MAPVRPRPVGSALDPGFAARLPAAHALLRDGGLVVHPAVTKVVLHGSRGLQGGARPDADVDLSLAVDVPPAARAGLERLFREVLDTTLDAWRGAVDLDLAAVFDVRGCDLACFDAPRWPEGTTCPWGSGRDCFGLFKVQRGFDGFVVGAGVEVVRMHPCVTVWTRPNRGGGA